MFVSKVPKIFAQRSPIHGLGVFAGENFFEGEIVEKAPILKLDIPHENPLLADYRFWWTESPTIKYYVVALGCGSLYNHSNEPNCKFVCNYQNNTMDFIALKNIKAGEEIFVDYGGEEYWSSRGHIQVK